MSRQSASIVIARSPDEVFAYMDDVSREVEWQPNLRSAEQDPPGPTTLGTRKRYVSRFMGRDVRNTYVVAELEPGRRIVYETEKGSAIEARSEILWEVEGTGTRVTMFLEGKPKGFLKLVPKAALELAYREELRVTLDRVKDRLESGVGGS
jgi:uncharacterized protein YndB with AHSA1/START domain